MILIFNTNTNISSSNLLPGDIVFWSEPVSINQAKHVVVLSNYDSENNLWFGYHMTRNNKFNAFVETPILGSNQLDLLVKKKYSVFRINNSSVKANFLNVLKNLTNKYIPFDLLVLSRAELLDKTNISNIEKLNKLKDISYINNFEMAEIRSASCVSIVLYALQKAFCLSEVQFPLVSAIDFELCSVSSFMTILAQDIINFTSKGYVFDIPNYSFDNDKKAILDKKIISTLQKSIRKEINRFSKIVNKFNNIDLLFVINGLLQPEQLYELEKEIINNIDKRILITSANTTAKNMLLQNYFLGIYFRHNEKIEISNNFFNNDYDEFFLLGTVKIFDCILDKNIGYNFSNMQDTSKIYATYLNLTSDLDLS